MVNDSTTQVNVTIKQPNRSLLNKLLVPVTDQNIEQDARDIVPEVYDILNVHLKITNVKVLGESEIAPVFCACRSLETDQIEKANGMMRNYELLTSFVSDFNLKTDGPPIVKVREWNHTLGKLKYDFCLPIVKTDSLPMNDSITYKDLEKEKVLHAIYHGNYITSDRAWYVLIRFAESNGYEIDGLPIEYFHNNPSLGLNEKKWRAEVYLPIR
jgi:effector-binding domain-containing protein